MALLQAVSSITEIDTTFRCVERSCQEAGRISSPRLVAQMDVALETHHIGQGRNNFWDYCATMPLFATSKPAALLTTEQQLRATMHALQEIGTDEMICFVWSAELTQIDRIAGVIG